LWTARKQRLQRRRRFSFPADHKTASIPATTDAAYVIGPEDVLDINVWKEPDVSRVVPVRPDGRISLPLINDVQAAGLSPQQLAGSVSEKLKKYLNGPQVTVIVTAINSQRVFVVGEVLRAGAFPMLPGMTVFAGAFKRRRVHDVRRREKIHWYGCATASKSKSRFNYRDVLKGDNAEQNIKLEAGDTIVVP